MTTHLFILTSLVTLLSVAQLPAQDPGSIDTNFSPADHSLGWYPLSPQADGKIIVGRDLDDFGVPLHLSVARLTVQGGYDSSFRPARAVCQRTGDAVDVRRHLRRD